MSAKILVLNAGSSSLKLAVFGPEGEDELTSRNVSWGSGGGPVDSHMAGLKHVLDGLDLAEVKAVGHRIVHGGTDYTAPVVIDDAVKAKIQELARLAPLHNPAALEVINAVAALLPNVPQVAAFDTSFHATLPPISYLYAVPYSWYQEWGVRRFGFHGLSHSYCAERAASMLNRPLTELKLITCHLGGGCSLAAIEDGKSLATTMGFTPLDGLMMGTRSGAVDPGLVLYLLEHRYFDTATELADALNNSSGLAGTSGIGGDMREIEQARKEGHAQAQLAFDLFVTRLVEGIGAYYARLGGLDVLVFSGGIGEHSAAVRSAVVKALAHWGLHLDEAANSNAKPDADLSAPTSAVRILAIRTREELVVARAARKLVLSFEF